jgi:hypothetical protein
VRAGIAVSSRLLLDWYYSMTPLRRYFVMPGGDGFIEAANDACHGSLVMGWTFPESFRAILSLER